MASPLRSPLGLTLGCPARFWVPQYHRRLPFDPSSRALDVLLGLGALATLVTLIRRRRAFFDRNFTAEDRRLAVQVAVFLIPPVVVLFHELGHLAAAEAAGADVTGFHYGLFEGSVTVSGWWLTAAQNWWISLAGNLVGALMGTAMMAFGAGRKKGRRPLRYVLLLGGLLVVLFSLVLYPFLSLATRWGDWIVVYSGATPVLSGATAVVHLAAVVGLYGWWRRRGRDALFAIGSGTEQAVADLKAAVAAAPAELAAWLALADFYARRGELGLARQTLQDAVETCGDRPGLDLALARLSVFQRRWNDAVIAARRGLDSCATGDSGPTGEAEIRQPLWANLALALTEMERPELALDAYAQLRPPLLDDVRVRYGRGRARLDTGDAGGRADLESVVAILPEGHLLAAWAAARLEGHPLKEWGDYSTVPAHERPSAPPPAPIGGL